MGPKGNRRGLWVLLFLISGLPALFSVLVLPFDPLGAPFAPDEERSLLWG